jgi:pimeloyl-ACP methyl ester carboxylesterase
VDWWDLGRDALAVMAGDGGAFGLGVGHSSGGAALAMAEVLAPGTFAALVLIEPVIFPPPFRRDPGSEMAEAARRRKRGFASPAEARANYLGRGPFARWTETAVDLYVAHGMRAEGDSWVLKCEPEVEAEFYASGNAHGVWERLEEVGCPVLIVAGDESPDHWTELTRAQVASFPRARLVTVPGTDHFVPMERPDVVAAAIARVAG